MLELTAIFQDTGAGDIRTYIQSGNVVFTADRKVLAGFSSTVSSKIESRFGLKIPVILRTKKELESAVQQNPYRNRTENPKELHIVFLEKSPEPAAIAVLNPRHSPLDEFTVISKDIFLYCPNGLGRSKLTTAWFDSKLKTVSTIRNWRTVNALIAL